MPRHAAGLIRERIDEDNAFRRRDFPINEFAPHYIAGGRLHREPRIAAQFAASVPLQRLGSPDEIKGLALLLASPAGSFITGTVIPVDGGATAMFSHPAGGTLCERCGHLARSGRRLPPAARAALRAWLNGDEHSLTSADEGRAHQRLLREFLQEHLTEDRPLRAFDAWERETLTAGALIGGAAQ